MSLCGIGQHVFIYRLLCIILTSLIFSAHGIDNGGSITINLSTFDKYNKTTHVFKQHDVLNGKAEINIQEVPSDVDFFIIQVHSYEHNVILSNTSIPLIHSMVNGTNVGLVEIVSDRSTFKYYLEGSESRNVSIMVIVIAYINGDPIPGGCCLTFDVEIAPFQKVYYTDYMVRVDAQAGSISDHLCEENLVSLDMYHMFLEELDFSSEGYFAGIEKMLTVDNIIKYGKKAPEPMTSSSLRRYYAAYKGTGSVYGIIATYGNQSAAYVPAVSYACDMENEIANCRGPVTTCWKLICGLFVFFGMFMCLFGHRFFQLSLFFTGFFVAAVLAYMVIFYMSLTFGETVATLSIIGMLYGGFWVIIWWRYGIPILSVILSFSVAGYIAASSFFFMGLADVQVFQRDVNYWCVLIGIMVIITLVLLILSPFDSNILATSFLGSYIFIIPIDHYVGGNLRYIFLNSLHRATVKNFNLAVIDPPFETNDRNLVIFWFFLTLAGVCAQLRHNRGRAPFPPPRSGSRRPAYGRRTRYTGRSTERSPLLA